MSIVNVTVKSKKVATPEKFVKWLIENEANLNYSYDHLVATAALGMNQEGSDLIQRIVDLAAQNLELRGLGTNGDLLTISLYRLPINVIKYNVRWLEATVNDEGEFGYTVMNSEYFDVSEQWRAIEAFMLRASSDSPWKASK